jgi:DNA polymerase-3 subunit delta'
VNLSWHDHEFQRLLRSKAALPHALLLHGPRGIGKLAFARALAQALLCESPVANGDACGSCAACGWFLNAGHPDFCQTEPASASDEDGDDTEKKVSITVHQIRALGAFVNVSSQRGGVKAVVVHPAEALNPNAANALLKSLEEPPPRTYFVLVSHRPHQLLPTIRSRCQQVALRAPDSRIAAEWLEGQGVRDSELALAHVGNAPLLALELSGTEYWGARSAFLRQLTAGEIDIIAAAEAIRDCPIPQVIAWLQKWSYDIVHYHTMASVKYNPDHLESITSAAAKANPLAALRFHREMVNLQRSAQHPLNARLFVEQMLMTYRDLLQPRLAHV